MVPQADPVDLAHRVEREREFYNASSGASRYRTLRRLIWRAIGEFNRDEELTRLFDAAGKTVLQYGCGPGFGVQDLIEQGALQITGLDISEQEIGLARDRARAAGYADRVDFVAADAHRTPFADNSFDLVVGISILHHLDLPVALAELRRILRPGGRAVFREPLGDNPLLRLGRLLTPAARTPDEHPLTPADWALCASIFGGFEHEEAELLSIPLMPLNLLIPRAWQRPLAKRVAVRDDRILQRHPQLRRYARNTFLILK